MLYRVFRGERKQKLKLLHAGIMFAVFFLTVIALKAVFDSHNLRPCPEPEKEGETCKINNLYSLHSWMGLITVILFTFQVRVTFKIDLNMAFDDLWRPLTTFFFFSVDGRTHHVPIPWPRVPLEGLVHATTRLLRPHDLHPRVRHGLARHHGEGGLRVQVSASGEKPFEGVILICAWHACKLV